MDDKDDDDLRYRVLMAPSSGGALCPVKGDTCDRCNLLMVIIEEMREGKGMMNKFKEIKSRPSA
jgi:hypothetical protein